MHDKDIALRLRMLPALAFASPFDVRELFPQVIEHINISEATELALYFERGGHVNPIYPIEMWITIMKYLLAFRVQLIP